MNVCLNTLNSIIERIRNRKIIKNDGKRNAIVVVIALVEAIILSYVMFSFAHTNSDLTLRLSSIDRSIKYYGGTLKGNVTPNTLSELAIYLGYYFFGATSAACRFIVAVWIFPSMVMACVLVLIKGNRRSISILGSLILCFIIFPTYFTNIYHYEATFFALYIYYLIDVKIWRRNWISIGMAIMMFATAWKFFGSDWFLLVLVVIVPLFVYSLIRGVQNQSTRKIVVYAVTCCIGAVSVLFATCYLIRGDKIVTGIYGAEGYLQWTALEDMVRVGIPLFVEFFSRMWSLPRDGSMIAFSSIVYILRYCFATLTIFILIRYAICIIKNSKVISTFEAVGTIAVVLDLCITMASRSNMSSYSDIGYWPDLMRYLVPACVIAPVLTARFCIDKLNSLLDNTVDLKGTVVSIPGSIGMISLLVLFYCIIDNDVMMGYQYFEVEAIDVIKANSGGVYNEGISFDPFVMDDITVLSDGEIQCTPVSNYLHLIYGWDYFPELKNNYRYICFAVSDSRHESYKIVEKQDYFAKIDIKNYTDLRHEEIGTLGTVFYFNHDIRWIPKILKRGEIKNNIEWNVTCGRTRIIVNGKNISKDSLNIIVPDSIVVESYEEDDEVTYIIDSTYNATINIEVDSANIEYMNIVPVYAAYKIAEDVTVGAGEDMYFATELHKGNYYVSTWGENIDSLNVETMLEKNSSIEMVSAGTSECIYKISVTDDTDNMLLKFGNVSEVDAHIEGIAIESSPEDLKKIKSQYQDSELGWITYEY